MDYLTTYASLSPIRRGFAPGVVNYKKGAPDSQSHVIKFTCCLPMVGAFSPGTPASSTTKTGRHDIAEIFLKVALNTKVQIQILQSFRKLSMMLYIYQINFHN